MSPTPIREALRLLQAEGMVEHHPHRGMAVAEYSPESAEEVYRLRVVLEPMATGSPSSARPTSSSPSSAPHHDALVAAVADDRSTRRRRAQRRSGTGDLRAHAGRGYLEDFIARLWQAIPVRAIWLTKPRVALAGAARGDHGRASSAATRTPPATACAPTSSSGRPRPSSTCAPSGASALMTDVADRAPSTSPAPARSCRPCELAEAALERIAAQQPSPERLHHRHRRRRRWPTPGASTTGAPAARTPGRWPGSRSR